MTSNPRHEPLYDVDPRKGARIEVSYADRALETFGRGGAAWFWCFRRRGYAPDSPDRPVRYKLRSVPARDECAGAGPASGAPARNRPTMEYAIKWALVQRRSRAQTRASLSKSLAAAHLKNGLIERSAVRKIERGKNAITLPLLPRRFPEIKMTRPPFRRPVRRCPNIWKILERAKGLEPSTPTLARSCSTTELHPHPRA